MKLRAGVFVVVALAMVAFASGASAHTYVVNSTADQGDFGTAGDGVCQTDDGNGVCTLRAAVHDANNLAGADVINFDSSVVGGEIVAQLGQYDITEAVTIDGCSSDPGHKGACVGIRGASVGQDLFAVLGSNVTLKGFALANAHQAVFYSFGQTGLVLRNNWIGIGIDGKAQPIGDPSSDVLAIGVELVGSDALVGGRKRIHRNVIANSGTGVDVRNSDNTIQGNWFGVRPNGRAAGNGTAIQVQRPNEIDIPTGTQIGGGDEKTPGVCDKACNLILNSESGLPDAGAGILLDGEEGPPGETAIQGNFIGLALDGTTAAPNETGIDVGRAHDVVVGGAFAKRNYIAGGDVGISQDEFGCGRLTVRNNRVGLNAAANGILPAGIGMEIAGCGFGPVISANEVVAGDGGGIVMRGADATVDTNIVNAAGGPGIWLLGAQDSTVQTNTVAGNNTVGILVEAEDGEESTGNLIGGATDNLGNVISGSSLNAIRIAGDGNDGNAATANRGTTNGGIFLDLLDPAGFGVATNAANAAIPSPAIDTASSSSVCGTGAPAAGTVFLYQGSPADSAGTPATAALANLGTATADAQGDWCVAPTTTPTAGTRVTAQALDAAGNASELSRVAVIP